MLELLVLTTILVGFAWRQGWVDPIQPFLDRERTEWLVIVAYALFVLLIASDVAAFMIVGDFNFVSALFVTVGTLGFGAALPEIGNFLLHSAREIISGGVKAMTSNIVTFFVSICMAMFLAGVALGIQNFVQAALGLAIIVGAIYLMVMPFLPKKDKK